MFSIPAACQQAPPASYLSQAPAPSLPDELLGAREPLLPRLSPTRAISQRGPRFLSFGFPSRYVYPLLTPSSPTPALSRHPARAAASGPLPFIAVSSLPPRRPMQRSPLPAALRHAAPLPPLTLPARCPRPPCPFGRVLPRSPRGGTSAGGLGPPGARRCQPAPANPPVTGPSSGSQSRTCHRRHRRGAALGPHARPSRARPGPQPHSLPCLVSAAEVDVLPAAAPLSCWA